MSKNRPMLNVTTADLVERISAGDVKAAREGMLRLAHGVRPYNARKLRTVLGDVLVDDIVETPVVTPVPTPAPAPAPALPEGITPEVIAQVLALVQGQVTGSVTPEPAPEPAPAPAPAPRRDFKAANLLAKRVSALKAAERRALVARSKAVAMDADLSVSDVESLSDADCLDLVTGA